MRYLLFIFALFCCLFHVNGQLSFSTTKHNFGELEPYSARYTDITVTNNGPKQGWILSVKKPMEVSYIVSKQLIEPDSSITLRFSINPSKKGKFNYTIDIYTSDRSDATQLKLSGSIRELSQDNGGAFTACPTFGERPGGRNPNAFDLTVVTIDKETRQPLSRSDVTMIQNGRPIWDEYTDRKGKIKRESTLGLSYFYATHDGYYPTELGAYVNFKRNYIVLELRKDERIVPVEPPIDTTVIIDIPEPKPEETIITIEERLEEELTETVDSSFHEEIIPPSLAELDPNNFDEQYFDPINVVFILDVSSSMKQADKMELMKYSLFQLTDMLRPQDKMGIVTYATDTRVLLPPTSGNQKEVIQEEIEALKAFGYTAGGSGIKLGFKQAKRSKISNGTNHVIIITDGAFNRNSDDYKKYVKKYQKQGINLSVVGIKNKEVDKQKMIDAATLGGGHYVPIFKLADAQNNLKQEIRVLTFKK